MEITEAHLSSAIADPDFERIALALREPNIFRALAIERREVRHSNFIAYLLDPDGNHGLRDIVLRKFLRDVFANAKAVERTPLDADTLDLRDVEVRREWRNIDLLIVLPTDVIVVENKIDASEHSNQLTKYRVIGTEAFRNRLVHFVYLTPFGSDPEREEEGNYWINYSYSQIAEIVATILQLYHESISDKIQHYLRDYLTTIKRDLLMNDKLNELAQKVYRAHRTAFDFVLENRPDPASELYPYFVTALNKAGFVIGSRNKGFVRFTSDKLSKQLPCTGQGWPDRELFLFEIDYFWNTKKAVVKAVIAPGDDKLRTRIHNAVKGLRDLKHPIRQPTGKKWWVFYINKSRSFVATEVANEDEAEIMKKVTEIVDDIKDDARAILAAIEKEICRA